MACEHCAGEGRHYPGPPRAAVSFWRASIIWSFHQLRLVFEKLGRSDRALYLSVLIRDFEEMTNDTNPGNDS